MDKVSKFFKDEQVNHYHTLAIIYDNHSDMFFVQFEEDSDLLHYMETEHFSRFELYGDSILGYGNTIRQAMIHFHNQLEEFVNLYRKQQQEQEYDREQTDKRVRKTTGKRKSEPVV